MKKIVLSIIIFLIFPLFVFADDGFAGPAIVINPNGTNIECDDKKVYIPYETEVVISAIYGDGECLVYYQDMECNAKTKDYKIITDYRIYNFYDGVTKVVIFDDNIKLFNGPDLDFSYTNNKKIPKGTILLAEYSYDDFVYVTYNNESGWILFDMYDIYDFEDAIYAVPFINEVAIISSKADVYTGYHGKKTGEVIKEHTLIHIYYGHDDWFYVNYDGKDMWINVDPDKVAYKIDNEYQNSNVTTYKSFETIDVYTGVKVNVPANTHIELVYQNKDIYNVCGNGAVDYAYYDSYLIYLDDCIYYNYKNTNSSSTAKDSTKTDSSRALLYFIIFIPVGVFIPTTVYAFTKKVKNNK